MGEVIFKSVICFKIIQLRVGKYMEVYEWNQWGQELMNVEVGWSSI